MLSNNHRPSRTSKGSELFGGIRPSHKDTYISESTGYPTSILYFNSDHNVNSYHNTQKPVALMEYLIRTFSNENDLVLDPCFGSATTYIACMNANRKFIGYELNEINYGKAMERLEKIKHNETKQNKKTLF